MVHQLASGFDSNCEIDFCRYTFEGRYPFPWNQTYFFNQMPETVLGISFEIKEQPISLKPKYDLIIFAFQPWFLHPSIPSWSIISHPPIQALLHNTPVVTLIGARNMWLNALECIKKKLHDIGALHSGNIVLVDGASNLASMITVQRWMFQGKKEATFFLPAAGIHANDILRLKALGFIVQKHLLGNTWLELQDDLVKSGAVQVKTQLIPLEQKGVNNFKRFAEWIIQAGAQGSKERNRREWVFSFLLPKVAKILSPITFVSNRVKRFIHRHEIEKQRLYFESVRYEKNIFR